MKKIFTAVLLLSTTLAFGGCSSGGSNTETGKLEKTISSLERTVDSLKAENEQLASKTTISSSETITDNSSDKNSTEWNLLAEDSDFGALSANGAENTILVERKDYEVSWSDNTWSGLNISADKVSVLKVDGYEDYSNNQYQGFILVHFNLENTERDLSVYPEQAMVNTNTGQQTEGFYELEGFAGDILKGSKIDGYAAYPVKQLEDVNDISNIRMKFNASYSTEDYDDENADHEYDLSLDLK